LHPLKWDDTGRLGGSPGRQRFRVAGLRRPWNPGAANDGSAQIVPNNQYVTLSGFAELKEKTDELDQRAIPVREGIIAPIGQLLRLHSGS
jgi:hypothetical protein